MTRKSPSWLALLIAPLLVSAGCQRGEAPNEGPVNVVTGYTGEPKVTLTSPTEGATFTSGESIPVTGTIAVDQSMRIAGEFVLHEIRNSKNVVMEQTKSALEGPNAEQRFTFRGELKAPKWPGRYRVYASVHYLNLEFDWNRNDPSPPPVSKMLESPDVWIQVEADSGSPS